MQPVQQDKKTHALEHFAKGCTWGEAAAACGVNRTTLWRWAESDPDFRKAIDDLNANADTEVEAITFDLACDPDPAHNTLRMFWLNARKGYKSRSEVNNINPAGGTTVIILPAKIHDSGTTTD